MTQQLYSAHVAERQRQAEAALAATGFEALVLHSGTPFLYFADDMHPPHHVNPHFAHWVPLAGPQHLLLVRPGEKPKLVRYKPEDYWYEQSSVGEPFWLDSFDFEEVGDLDEAWKRVAGHDHTAYVGDADGAARQHGFEPTGVNPEPLTARLDWGRSFKTAYEVDCLEEATIAAARGHHAARAVFDSGASELEIHQAYVAAVGCVDKELPYESIVALDEKGATLHYVGKRTVKGGAVLLIDSGAMHQGYCSDITRTWTRDGCPQVFRDLVAGMDRVQQELCDSVRPGVPYPDLHASAHVRIGDLLHVAGVLKVGGEEALAQGLTAPFFPHGLGHFLGIQVHDVAGHQKELAGGTQEPPASHPYLRTTRTIEANQVFTIEPGLYFIEMLLREYRIGPKRELFDWILVDELAGYGGVRIEDNILVTPDGHRNLTRPHV